jgi:beta-glucosidase
LLRPARGAFLVLLTLAPAVPLAAQTPTLVYRDPAAPVEARVADLLSRMTLEEKFWQLYMSPGSLDDPSHDYSHGAFGLQIRMPESAVGDAEASPGALARAHAGRIDSIQRYFVEETRLGIPIIPFEEALHGLVAPGATAFPQAIGLAATFDTALVSRVAEAIARETRSRGIRDALSPVVNVATDVRWGRVEETYGEDPWLVSRMAVAFVGAFERAGVVATPKHFVANVGAGGRDSYPIHLDERILSTTHFPPFLAAIREGGARSVMTAYNSVNGVPATQNAWLLNGVLKGRWGFDGFVISDASATGGATVLHHTEASTASAVEHALTAGLDVVFQSRWEEHRPYLEAFRSGRIADSVIDAAVARVLRAKFELGLFERPYADPDSAAFWSGDPAHRALAREAARASMVLLRNEGRALPLDPGALRRVAVIGLDAAEARPGGYSGPGNAPVSILDGIRSHVPEARYAPGPGRRVEALATVPGAALSSVVDGQRAEGLRGEYWSNPHFEGKPVIVRRDAAVDFRWTLSSPGRGIPHDWYAARWIGALTAGTGGVHRLGVTGDDGYRLWLDGTLVLDNWEKRGFGTRVAEVDLVPGSEHDIRLEYFETTGNARVNLIWDAGEDAESRASAAIDSAVALARGSDVAIVVAGIEEGEFRDRAFLGLPGRQEELIRAVAATGTPVVVVLVGGSAITMPWLDRAGAVLLAWYPGEAGGDAVADVLFGDADPGGRLPITFPVTEGQLPLVYDHEPTGRCDDYVDLTGRPLFPFAYGLSYTRFEYSGLTVEPAEIPPQGHASVTVRVRNAGDRAGDEVVQLYVRDVLASVARPVQQLAGFRRIRLAPDEEREVSFDVGPAQLRLLDQEMRWVVEPGVFRLGAGRSSRDIRARADLVVRP